MVERHRGSSATRDGAWRGARRRSDSRRGHLAMVGDGCDRSRRESAPRRDHLDGRPRRRRREARGGRPRAFAGVRAAQAPQLDQAHGRRAGIVGQGLDRAHPVAATRASRHRARHVEVPRAQGLAQPQADGPVRGHLRLDRAALDHRQPRPQPHQLRPRPLARVRGRSRAVTRSRPGHVGARSPRSGQSRRVGGARGDPRGGRYARSPVGCHRVGRGPRFRGASLCRHVVVAHVSRSLQEDRPVPRHRVAPIAAPRQVLRGRRAGSRRRKPQLVARQHHLPRRRAAADHDPRRLLSACSTTSRPLHRPGATA